MEGLKESEDDILLQASQIYEDSCLEKDENDVLMEASQIYEDSLINNTSSSELEEYMCLREKYENMDEDDFLYDRLIAPLQEAKLPTQKTTNDRETKKENRFANPVTEEDILAKIVDAIPSSTRKQTTWTVKVWQDWTASRRSLQTEVPPQLDSITNEQLNYWLSQFIVEVKNKNGESYTGGTLYSLCSGVQRYIRGKRAVSSEGEALDIYKDPKFVYFRSVFDSVLKNLHKRGIGTSRKQAEVISYELEESLWSKGVLGDDELQKLVDSFFGLNLALRSGREHRNLRPDMLELKELCHSNPYILYTECGSKNNPGGLRE